MLSEWKILLIVVISLCNALYHMSFFGGLVSISPGIRDGITLWICSVDGWGGKEVVGVEFEQL